MPVPVWQEKFFQNFVNSMGIVKLEDGKYLLMRATANARELDFWISPTLEDVSGFLTDDEGGGFWDRWYHDELDPTGTHLLFDCDYIVYDDGDKGYQNTNLVTDCQTGEIYLIGTHGRCPGPIRLGSDFVDEMCPKPGQAIRSARARAYSSQKSQKNICCFSLIKFV